MPAEIKAVVFRTSKLKETKEFFIAKLGVAIKEYSMTHFVIHSRGIRLLFVESDNDLEVELYVSKVFSPPGENNLTLHGAQKFPARILRRSEWHSDYHFLIFHS